MAGRRPKELDDSEALKALLKSRSLYGEEPQHLAQYNFDKLRVCRGDVVPKDAVRVLPEMASGFLRHHKTQIARSTEEIADALQAEDLPRPYWNPTLRRNKGNDCC